MLGNTKAHLRKQFVWHIRREEGHGIFKDVEDENGVKLLAIWETYIQSEIGSSHYGKDNIPSEINENSTVQTHAYVYVWGSGLLEEYKCEALFLIFITCYDHRFT